MLHIVEILAGYSDDLYTQIRKGEYPMKMILKILVWPVALLLRMFCILGVLLYNAAAYVISPLLLLSLGCCIYCAVQARWTELAIFAVTMLGLFLILFVMIWLVENAESLREWMGDFLAS